MDYKVDDLCKDCKTQGGNMLGMETKREIGAERMEVEKGKRIGSSVSDLSEK